MRAFPDECDLLRWEDDGGNPKITTSREMDLAVHSMVEQVQAKCETLGIDLLTFYNAMLEQQKVTPRVHPLELFRLTFLRIAAPTTLLQETPAPPAG